MGGTSKQAGRKFSTCIHIHLFVVSILLALLKSSISPVARRRRRRCCCHRSILQCDVASTNVSYACVRAYLNISLRIYVLYLCYGCSRARLCHSRCLRAHSLLFRVLFHSEYHAIQVESSRAEQSKQGSFLWLGTWAIVCKQYKYDVIFGGLFSRVGFDANAVVTTFFHPVFLIISSHICLFSSCFFPSFLFCCYCRFRMSPLPSPDRHNAPPPQVATNVFHFHFLCG